MKITKFLALISLVGLFFLSSCKKDTCHICVYELDEDDTFTICKEDVPFGYQITINSYEDNGYNCSKQ